MTSEAHCTNCGSELLAGAPYCHQCGTGTGSSGSGPRSASSGQARLEVVLDPLHPTTTGPAGAVPGSGPESPAWGAAAPSSPPASAPPPPGAPAPTVQGGRRWLGVVIALAVVLIAGAGTAFALTRGGGGPSRPAADEEPSSEDADATASTIAGGSFENPDLLEAIRSIDPELAQRVVGITVVDEGYEDPAEYSIAAGTNFVMVAGIDEVAEDTGSFPTCVTVQEATLSIDAGPIVITDVDGEEHYVPADPNPSGDCGYW